MGSSGPEDPARLVAEVAAALGAQADRERARAMAAYMRDRYPFLGVLAPARRRAARPLVAAARRWESSEAVAAVDRLWDRPEREYRYVGCDVARAVAGRWDPGRLADLRRWVTTDSWWDTVDPLAVATGDLVEAHSELVADMDRWADDADPWVARVALLHQLGRKERCDPERLFVHCARRADDGEFFIRKAIGWALRDAARTYPRQVRDFVDRHPELSPLSRREALKHLGGA